MALVAYRCPAFSCVQRQVAGLAALLTECGYQCQIFSASWAGAVPEGVNLQLAPPRFRRGTFPGVGFLNWLDRCQASQPADCRIAIGLIPGQDICIASDYVCSDQRRAGRWWQRGSRTKLAALEADTYGRGNETRLLFHSERQRDCCLQRFPGASLSSEVLPAAIFSHDRYPEDARERRASLRLLMGVEPLDYVLLWAGTEITELDLVIEAVAVMIEQQPSLGIKLMVASELGDSRCMRRAERFGIEGKLVFAGSLIELVDLLVAADVLVHPATRETVGLILLKAIVGGLPSVSTNLCHYSEHVIAARCGTVIRAPLDVGLLVKPLLRMIDGIFRVDLRESGLLYAHLTDLYSGHERVVTLIENMNSEQADA